MLIAPRGAAPRAGLIQPEEVRRPTSVGAEEAAMTARAEPRRAQRRRAEARAVRGDLRGDVRVGDGDGRRRERVARVPVGARLDDPVTDEAGHARERERVVRLDRRVHRASDEHHGVVAPRTMPAGFDAHLGADPVDDRTIPGVVERRARVRAGRVLGGSVTVTLRAPRDVGEERDVRVPLGEPGLGGGEIDGRRVGRTRPRRASQPPHEPDRTPAPHAPPSGHVGDARRAPRSYDTMAARPRVPPSERNVTTIRSPARYLRAGPLGVHVIAARAAASHASGRSSTDAKPGKPAHASARRRCASRVSLAPSSDGSSASAGSQIVSMPLE